MARPVRRVGDAPVDLAGALAWAGALDTLEDVLARRLTIVDIVVQDELTPVAKPPWSRSEQRSA